MPKPTPDQLAAGVPQAIDDLVASLRDIGKTALADAAAHLADYGPDLALWQIERLEALRTNDEAKLDELERTIEVLAADAVLALASVGVRAQEAGENGLQSLLKLLSRFVLAGVA